jgi:hypothetical protein
LPSSAWLAEGSIADSMAMTWSPLRKMNSTIVLPAIAAPLPDEEMNERTRSEQPIAAIA